MLHILQHETSGKIAMGLAAEAMSTAEKRHRYTCAAATRCDARKVQLEAIDTVMFRAFADRGFHIKHGP